MEAFQIIYPIQMRQIILILLLCFVKGIQAQALFSEAELNNPNAYIAKFDSIIPSIEMPLARLNFDAGQVIFKTSYADWQITDTSLWSSGYRGDTLYLVMSKYPVKLSDWQIGYHKLLAERLKSIYKIIPELNSRLIPHRVILQTSCSTESEAKALFHGYIVKAHHSGNRNRPASDIKVKGKTIQVNAELKALDTTFYPKMSL